MNGSNHVRLSMNSPLPNSNSNKINSNVDPNFGSNSMTQALTNACIIVPVVCFVGTVMTILLGVTMCKMNKTCDRCLLLRMFQGRDKNCTEVARPVYARTAETEQTYPRHCPTCNHPLQNSDPQDTDGILNPLYNGFDSIQLNSPEGIRLNTFKPGVFTERNFINGGSEFDTSEASRIVKYDGSSLEKRSLLSSEDMYQERIRNFLRDSFPTAHKACRLAAAPVHNRGPTSSFQAESCSVLTQNTFVDDSSHTENEMCSINSSFFENRPLSDVSRIVHYSRSHFGSAKETKPMGAENLHLCHCTPEEQGAVEVMNLSSDSLESFSTTYIRAPPPSPNTDILSDCTQVENFRCSNGTPGPAETRQQSVLVENRTQGSWVTAQSPESREQSLEWDNYQQFLSGCISGFTTPCPETPDTLVPLEEELFM